MSLHKDCFWCLPCAITTGNAEGAVPFSVIRASVAREAGEATGRHGLSEYRSFRRRQAQGLADLIGHVQALFFLLQEEERLMYPYQGAQVALGRLREQGKRQRRPVRDVRDVAELSGADLQQRDAVAHDPLQVVLAAQPQQAAPLGFSASGWALSYQ